MRIHNIYITKSVEAAAVIKEGLNHNKDNVINSGYGPIHMSIMVPPYMKDQYKDCFVAYTVEEILNDSRTDEWNYVIC